MMDAEKSPKYWITAPFLHASSPEKTYFRYAVVSFKKTFRILNFLRELYLPIDFSLRVSSAVCIS
jgi:hypothetical protein